jgi:hypothetical protein
MEGDRGRGAARRRTTDDRPTKMSVSDSSLLGVPRRPTVSLLASMPPLFGLLCLKRSTPLWSDTAFTQTDPTHWVLDLTALAGPLAADVQDVCLFLPENHVLPPELGFALHVRAAPPGGAFSEWEYRGYCSAASPSEVFPAAWPGGGSERPAACQVGVTVEPLAELSQREATAVASRGEFAKRVAQHLFRFLSSFPSSPRGTETLIPNNALGQWLDKFQQRFARDPDFLLRIAVDG